MTGKLGLQRVVFISMSLYCLLLMVFVTPPGRRLENDLGLWVNFQFRKKVGKEPIRDPHLKVFEVSSQSATIDWLTDVVEYLHEKKGVKSIYINKVFHYRYSKDSRERRFISVLSKIPNLSTSLFIQPRQNQFPGSQSSPNSVYAWTEPSNLGPTLQQDLEVYGPHQAYHGVFKNVGHYNLEETPFFYPSVQIKKGRAVRHFVLSGLDQNQMMSIPVDEEGLALIDYSSALFQSHLSQKALDKAVYEMDPLVEVSSKDTVFLLLAADAGSATIETPLGVLPASYANVAILNSRLSHQWLVPRSKTAFWLFVVAVAATAVASVLHGVFFLAGLVSGAAVISIGGMIAFSFGYVFPWASAACMFFLVAVSLYLEKTRALEKKTRRIRDSLSGLVGDEKLERLLKSPGRLRLTPEKHRLTVMFIDMVGFSLTAEKITAEELFKDLKFQMSELSRIIHRYGGVVDKSLGDGLLCFFGYEFGDTPSNEAASKAVQCAIRLQQFSIEQSLKRVSAPIYPLRIGVATDEVIVGDLGGDNRLDFTVLGAGVNFAQRLESACEPFRVLISSATFAEMGEPPSGIDLVRREIQIKHHGSVYECFEVTLRGEHESLIAEVAAKYRRQAALVRDASRVECADSVRVELRAGHQFAEVVNYSHTGLAILCDAYYSKGMELSLRYEGQEVLTIVQWGKTQRNQYLHGLKFVSNQSIDAFLAHIEEQSKKAS